MYSLGYLISLKKKMSHLMIFEKCKTFIFGEYFNLALGSAVAQW